MTAAKTDDDDGGSLSLAIPLLGRLTGKCDRLWTEKQGCSSLVANRCRQDLPCLRRRNTPSACCEDAVLLFARLNPDSDRMGAYATVIYLDANQILFETVRIPNDHVLDYEPEKAAQFLRLDEGFASQNPVELLQHHVIRWGGFPLAASFVTP